MKSAKVIGFTAALLLAAAQAARADVAISNKPTSNMSCDAGVCTSTARDAVLNVGDLATMLASGDVAVKTGSLAKDIDIDQPLQWTSTSRLTLDAQKSVVVKKQVTVTGTGAVAIVTNDGGSGGDLLFLNKGSVTFADTGSSLVINGQGYTLVKDIATLAADIAANPSGLYALAADYDASVDGTFTASPILTTFEGSFEGLGHTISNLSIATQNVTNTGFFAYVGSAGVIQHLVLHHASVSTQASSVTAFLGALAGENDGTIDWIRVTGSVIGSVGLSGTIGGVAGTDKGLIVNAGANVKVVSKGDTARVGGLSGLVDGMEFAGQIENSFADGNVTGSFKGAIGGLVGDSFFGSIQLSRADGVVTSNGPSAVGGLIGANAGSIDQSFATGRVQLKKVDHTLCYGSAGGLAGRNSSTITNSYAAGSVDGSADACIGGLVGYDASITDTSYAIGHVSGGANAKVGGFAGKYFGRSAKASDCYWDTETSGTADASGNKANVKGVKGLTTQELQSGLPAGFDPKIWAESPGINGGFPYLLANPPK